MFRRSAVHTLVAVALLLQAGFSQAPTADDPSTLRNIGRSQYEEEKYADAAQTFEKLLKLRPDSAVDHVNLGIVLVQLERYDEARTHLERGEALDPTLAPYAAYNTALSYKRQRDFAKAAAGFEKALKLDPRNPDTAYNLAVVYEGLGQLDRAFQLATLATELLPDEIAPHYRRMMIAVRQKNMEVANLEKNRMAELRAQDARNRTPAELEMSIYTEIAEPERGRPVLGPAEPKPSGVKFVDVTEGARLTGSSMKQPRISWVDVNGDGLPDLSLVARDSGLKLWLNSGSGSFKEHSVSAELAGLASAGVQAWGDIENDGDNDACVASAGRIAILLNDGKGTLTSGGQIALEGEVSDLLLVDYDHEGDLDLYVAVDSRPPIMYQNDGKGKLAPAPGKTGLSTDQPFARLAFFDFDDDNDTDFLLTGTGHENVVLSNLRVGVFQDVAKKLGLEAPARNVVVTDVNNDQWRDLVFWRDNGEVAVCVGTSNGPFRPVTVGQVDAKATALASLDYDNDGDEDLWVGNRLLQNDGSFGDVSGPAGLDTLGDTSEAQPCDFDADGDLDVALAMSDGSIRLLKNEGGNKNSWLRVQLDGIQTNRFGVGAKVEVRAGEFFQRKIADGGLILFGLGERKAVDVLRLWWPTGVAQNLLSPAVGGVTAVKEKLGPPSSCPFIYLWDGKQFSFFTDVLDLAALGVPLDHDTMLPNVAKEDLLIPGSLIRPRDGKVTIQLTGELRELIYLDSVRLSYFDHAGNTEVFNLDFNGSPAHASPDLLEVEDLRPARIVRNEAGQDLTSDLARQDQVYGKSGVRLTRFNGLAESHSLVLDFGDLTDVRRPVLVLQGWINWIDGDTLFALGQGAGSPPAGPSLEIQTDNGPWRKVSENIGTPAGIGKHLIFEIPRELCGKSTRLRISTNLELYWDRAAVGNLRARHTDRHGDARLLASDLHFRGFSEIHRKTAGSPPWYDYYQVSVKAPWKPQRGLLTRYGSVRPLLSQPDDRLVVFGPGDELTLVFDSPPPPAPGMRRMYVMRFDGWIKDANSSTRTGDTVEPLPRRDMVNYPFGPEPDATDRDYWLSIDENNTRALDK